MLTIAIAVPLLALGATGAFVEPAQLSELEDLPNPFVFFDGSPVTTREDWPRRRAEVADMLAFYEYGHMPPAPDNLQVADASEEPFGEQGGTLKRAVLRFGPDDKASMNVAIFMPPVEQRPCPIVLCVEPIWKERLWPVARMALDRGYALAGYDPHDLDADNEDRSDGMHPLYPGYDWATIAVWAWGAMRLTDYVLTVDGVDPAKLALTGHSRMGKTALLASALDERIAVAAPHASGCGGASSFRITEKGVETLGLITMPSRFHYWFQPRLHEFFRKENRLPFDQHFLAALVAPRPVVRIEGLEDQWANPLGTQQMWRAVQPVYDFLGAPDANLLYVRPGGHDTTDEDWRVLFDCCDHFFRGKPRPAGVNDPPFPDAPKPFLWTPPATR